MNTVVSLLLIIVPTIAMEVDTISDIPATSKIGSRILSKARMLEGDNENSYTSWVSGYSIKFDRCVSAQNYYGGYFAGEGGGANAQYYDANAQYGQYNGQGNGQYQQAAYYQQSQGGNRELQNNNGGYYYGNQGDEYRKDYNGMYEQRLVHFKLCPSDSCFSCKNGADYVVDLTVFIDAMMEATLTAHEYNCEHVKENCYCENANSKNSCLTSCYQNANMDYCYEDDTNSFNLQDALQCSQLDVDETAMENYYFQNRKQNEGYYNKDGHYFVGPYCSANGKKIVLGLFMEETCTYPAPDGTYEALNYGQQLPHSKKSLITHSCTSCKEPSEQNNQNYWDQQDSDSVLEVCETLYESAGKCEENLKLAYGIYPNNMACEFIKSVKTSYLPTAIPAKVFAGIFAVTTVALGALTVNLFRRSNRQEVNLMSPSHPLE